jgi:hypothetical protein
MLIKQTHTYAILVVAQTTWSDVYSRLKAAGVLDQYLHDDDKIVLGAIALVSESPSYNGPG